MPDGKYESIGNVDDKHVGTCWPGSKGLQAGLSVCHQWSGASPVQSIEASKVKEKNGHELLDKNHFSLVCIPIGDLRVPINDAL